MRVPASQASMFLSMDFGRIAAGSFFVHPPLFSKSPLTRQTKTTPQTKNKPNPADFIFSPPKIITKIWSKMIFEGPKWNRNTYLQVETAGRTLKIGRP
jgi:hypothetical protein